MLGSDLLPELVLPCYIQHRNPLAVNIVQLVLKNVQDAVGKGLLEEIL